MPMSCQFTPQTIAPMLLLVMKEKHADFVFLEEKTYIFPKFESPALPSAGPGNSKKAQRRDQTFCRPVANLWPDPTLTCRLFKSLMKKISKKLQQPLIPACSETLIKDSSAKGSFLPATGQRSKALTGDRVFLQEEGGWDTDVYVVGEDGKMKPCRPDLNYVAQVALELTIFLSLEYWVQVHLF